MPTTHPSTNGSTEAGNTTQLMWLVTGCSSGIGKAFIETILKRGDLAIATARDVKQLDHLKALGAETLQLDVTDSREVLESKVQAAVRVYGKIDVLIQNAGFGTFGPVEELEESSIRDIYDTNVFGVLRLVRSVMPHWRERKFGHHVVISSLDGENGMAGFGSYSSSKAALNRLIESFDQEVEPLGYIKNLIIKPGLFRTQFQSKVRDSLPSDSKHYQWLADEYAQSLDQIIGQQPGDPVRLADVVFDIVHEKDIRGNSTREAPLSLPLGKDAFDEMVESCERTLKTLRQWEDVVKSTDFPP